MVRKEKEWLLQMFDLEIKNAQIITNTEKYFASVTIHDGKIYSISKEPLGKAKKEIEASGLLLLPGMIDQHVHFMDPSETEREDFIHGSKAAISGGVTTVIEHTHSKPVRDVTYYREKVDYLRDRSYTNYGLTAHVFPEDLGNLKDLWDEGVKIFKIFTCSTHGIPHLNNDQLYRAFQEIKSFEGYCLVHCEDDSITARNEYVLKKENRLDNGIINDWRTQIAEEVAVSTVAFLARKTKVNATIAHVSHPLVVDLINKERELGANLHAEICPQYLFLNDKIIEKEGPFAKFTPPARSIEQTKKLLENLKNGDFKLLSTDHAPSTVEQKKEGNIWDCNFGLPGVETTLVMMLDLVDRNIISMENIVEMYSVNPAKMLNMYPQKGHIGIGSDADLVLIEPNHDWVIKNENIISKSGWTPFNNKKVNFKPVYTIVNGNVVMDNQQIIEEELKGKPI